MLGPDAGLHLKRRDKGGEIVGHFVVVRGVALGLDVVVVQPVAAVDGHGQLGAVAAEAQHAAHHGQARDAFRHEVVERFRIPGVSERVDLRPAVHGRAARPPPLGVFREPDLRAGGDRPEIEAPAHLHGTPAQLGVDVGVGVVGAFARVDEGGDLVGRELVGGDALVGEVL